MSYIPSNVQGVRFTVLVHRRFAFGWVFIVANICHFLPLSYSSYSAAITKISRLSLMFACLTVVFCARVLICNVCM